KRETPEEKLVVTEQNETETPPASDWKTEHDVAPTDVAAAASVAHQSPVGGDAPFMFSWKNRPGEAALNRASASAAGPRAKAYSEPLVKRTPSSCVSGS